MTVRRVEGTRERVRSWKPYPAYRDSGVEWLGQIPPHWAVFRLKYLASLNSDSLREDTDPSTEILYVDIGSVDTLGRITGKEALTFGAAPSRARHIVKHGDVIVSTVRTYLRAIAPIIDPEPNLVVSTGLAVVRPGERLTPGYASYALRAPYFVERVVANSKGVSFPAINESEMATYELAVPPIGEQHAIAEFLGRETAKIDELIAKKEQLTKLLQEERTALITRAVTKGLDPNVSMKDSGIEWLGEVPAHWQIVSLKRRTTRIQTGTTPSTSEASYYDDADVPWYGPGSFGDGLALRDPTRFVSHAAVRDGVARIFEPGSAAVVTIGATIGKAGFIERSGTSNQQITCVTFDCVRVFPKYGAYQLKRLEPVLRGIAPNTTLPILDQEEIGYLPFAVPPMSEQSAIVAFLDTKIESVDALRGKIVDAIARLKELRGALISAAVTGKIDVREEPA